MRSSILRRRTLLSTGGVIGAAAILKRARAATKFVVTEPVHGVDSLPFYLAVRKGFFKAANLDIELITAEGGGRHIAAVLSGDAQAFIGGPEHIAFAKVKGGKELRAVVSMANRANIYMVAAKSLNVDPAAPLATTLKGKRIGIGTRGGTGYSVMMYLLAREKLDPTQDVTLLEIAASAGRLAAVRAGEADMVMLNEPLIAQGMKVGLWNEPFLSVPKMLGPFAYTTINLPLEMLQKQPETVTAVVAGMRKGLEFTFANPQEAFDIAHEEFPTLPPDDLKAVMKRALDDDLWERSGVMPEAAWATLLAVVRGGGLLERDVAYNEVFDPRFLDAAG